MESLDWATALQLAQSRLTNRRCQIRAFYRSLSIHHKHIQRGGGLSQRPINLEHVHPALIQRFSCIFNYHDVGHALLLREMDTVRDFRPLVIASVCGEPIRVKYTCRTTVKPLFMFVDWSRQPPRSDLAPANKLRTSNEPIFNNFRIPKTTSMWFIKINYLYSNHGDISIKKRFYWLFTCLLSIFIFLFFCTSVLFGSNWLYARLSLSHKLEQFGSLQMCTPRKDISRSKTWTRYPRALSQPRY